jgi:hypothetical protein
VRTTPVTSVSGDAADPPADSDTLLAAALERGSARRQNTTFWSHHLPADVHPAHGALTLVELIAGRPRQDVVVTGCS